MERSGLSVPCMASQILAPGHSSSRKPGRQGEWPWNHSPGPACQSAAAGAGWRCSPSGAAPAGPCPQASLACRHQRTGQEGGMAMKPQPRPCLAGSRPGAACTACPRLWQWPAGWGPRAPSPRVSLHPPGGGHARLDAGHVVASRDSPGRYPHLSAAPPQGLPEAVVGRLAAPNSTARCLQVFRDPWAPDGPKRRRRRPTSSPCSTCCRRHLQWPPQPDVGLGTAPPLHSKVAPGATGPLAPIGQKRRTRRHSSGHRSKSSSSHLHWPPVAAHRPREVPPVPGKQSTGCHQVTAESRPCRPHHLRTSAKCG